MKELSLHPDHKADLQESGLSDESIEKSGIYSVAPGDIPKTMGWDAPISSLLAFPYPGTDFIRHKLFPPYQKKGESRAQKYHQSKGSGIALYKPPGFDADKDLIMITEGEKKALRSMQEGLNCIALGGIWNFAVKDKNGKPQLIDDFNSIEWIDRKVELVPDSDFQKKIEVKHAVYRLGTLLEQRGAKVSVVCLPIQENIGKLDDYLCENSIKGFEGLRRISLTHKLFSDAKKREKQSKEQKENQPEKQPTIAEDIEPWETPVDGCEILHLLHDTIKAHIVLDPPAVIACTLWIILTYCYDLFRILPILAVTSPEKRCGKTTLLEILSGLSNKPLLASNISPSAVFRTIEKYGPCLLIDEADTFLKDNEELRGIINSGHTRKSAFVIRTNTVTLDPERFSTWGPKAIALIGGLPGTIIDRSVSIRLERKTTSEKVTKVSIDFDEEQMNLRRMIKRWATDNTETLKNTTPTIPETGNDRAADNWTPLLGIAELAGGDWPDRTRKAMLDLEEISDEDSIRQTLLRDIKEIFVGLDKISSKVLIEKLIKVEDHPWSEWRKGKSITQNGLARLLKPFNILSKTIRTGDGTAKGYTLEQFIDPFKRYLPSTPPVQSVTPSQPTSTKDLRGFQSVTQSRDVTVENRLKPTPAKECDVVTVEKGGGQERMVFDDVRI